MACVDENNRNESNIDFQSIERYYNEKFLQYGADPRGVDWKNVEHQITRFEKLTTFLPKNAPFTLNDLGCGYGELVNYLEQQEYVFSYNGYDIVESLVKSSRERFANNSKVTFYRESKPSKIADFTIANGIFNIPGKNKQKKWQSHVFEIINEMASASKKGFSFNFLSTYSDKQFQKEHLYYENPTKILRYCLENFSKNVNIIHGYSFFEFTCLVMIES